jgi:hypothetical protein
MSLAGILHLDVFPCAVNGEIFNTFIEGLLDVMSPFPGPNSVLVMDNASIHKTEGLAAMIEARYVSYYIILQSCFRSLITSL